MDSFTTFIDPLMAVICYCWGGKKNLIWLHKPLSRRLSRFLRRNPSCNTLVNLSARPFVPGLSAIQRLGKVADLQVSSGVAGIPSGWWASPSALVCAEWATRGQFVEREIVSVSVGGQARRYPGNKMNGFFPDS